MDSTQSEAERIRAKRLAKLGGSGQATAPATPRTDETPVQTSTTTTPSGQTSIDVTAAPATNQENPFSQLGLKDAEKKPANPQITVKPKPRPASPAKRERDGSERPRQTERQPENLSTWQDKNLRQIFRVTVRPEETTDLHGHSLVYLDSVRQELSDDNKPALLDVDSIEGIIMEAATQAPGGKSFEYLLQCFKRTSRAMRGSKLSGPADPKHEILKEVRRLCMSYCVFAATTDMFGDSTTNVLVDHLLADPECDRGICYDFLTEVSSRIDDEDEIKDAIVRAVEEMSGQLSRTDMLGDYQTYVRALRGLFRFPKIVGAVTQSALWTPPEIEPQEIETRTILGPFFRLSPMQREVAISYFSAPKTRDKGFIASAQDAVRLTLRTLQSELFQIADTVVRAGAAPRERMLSWFAMCVNKNHKKRAMRVDYKVVSSDGFMVNVTTVLDQLCDPFMDATFSKITKIDVDYLRRNPRVDITDETKINADQKTSDDFYAHKAEGTSNFISEIFFLTVAAHHYGTEAAQTRMSQLRKTVQRMEKDAEQFEAERHKYISDPRYLQRFDEQLKKVKKSIDDTWSSIHATHGVLLDDLNQARAMQFMRYVVVWLLRIASHQELPTEEIRLPLQAEQSDVFRCLPEYFLEDIVENFKFITGNIPRIITPQQCDELVQVCVTFLRNSEYVKNPGVKSGLVTILFYGVMPYYNHSQGVLGDLLIGSPFAHKHLLHALMKFYIEAESTGTHNQFYDKFNIRYEIFQVIKRIWVNSLYRENLAKEARINTDFFIQFVNMLVNDVTFVLDESLSSFIKIHDLTKELAESSNMQDLSEEERKEKQELLEEQKGKAKSYMGLTRETMETLILFTETLADSFTMKEIVTRLADMLDYNLETMVGPKSHNLKVDQAQEYGFDPKQLLSDIMTVFINLSGKQGFITAIARDGRSYKPANFEKAMSIMQRTALKSPDELRVWQELAENVAKAKALEDEEEQDFGDAPDEFMDPLVADLMSDPVTLPISRLVVDRSTIRSHLLSDPTDPFNRTPLKIEDVIPNVELKEQIEKWKADKRAERAKNKMDTSDG